MVPVEYTASCTTFVVHEKSFEGTPYNDAYEVTYIEYSAHNDDNLIWYYVANIKNINDRYECNP